MSPPRSSDDPGDDPPPVPANPSSAESHVQQLPGLGARGMASSRCRSTASAALRVASMSARRPAPAECGRAGAERQDQSIQLRRRFDRGALDVDGDLDADRAHGAVNAQGRGSSARQRFLDKTDPIGAFETASNMPSWPGNVVHRALARSQAPGRALAGDMQHRRAGEIALPATRHRVRRARAGRGEHHPEIARDARNASAICPPPISPRVVTKRIAPGAGRAVQNRDVVDRDDAECRFSRRCGEEFRDQVADVIGAVRDGASRLFPWGRTVPQGNGLATPAG